MLVARGCACRDCRKSSDIEGCSIMNSTSYETDYQE